VWVVLVVLVVQFVDSFGMLGGGKDSTVPVVCMVSRRGKAIVGLVEGSGGIRCRYDVLGSVVGTVLQQCYPLM